jgi:hypothetical protein
MVSGDIQQVEADLQAKLKKEYHIRSAIDLLQLLGAEKKMKEGEMLLGDLARRIQGGSSENSRTAMIPFECLLAYSAHDFSKLETLTKSIRPPANRDFSFQALIEQNKLAEAEALLESDKQNKDPFTNFTLYLASQLAGDSARAKKWYDQSLKMLEEGSKDDRHIAALLNRPTAPTDEEIFAVVIDPKQKSIWTAVLKYRFNSDAARLAKLTKLFNVELSFPHYLLDRAASAL